MRRLLLSLPVALLLLMVFVSPCLASKGNLFATSGSTGENELIFSNSNLVSMGFVAADNVTLPEGLSLSPLLISPPEVNKGELVSVKVTATNNSPSAIKYALVLIINSKTAGSKQLSLEPAKSQDVIFTVVTENVGANNVQVGNRSGTFSVKSGGMLDMFPPWLWAVMGIVLVVIVVLVFLMITAPSRKKKAGLQTDQSKIQMKPKGRPGKPGAESQIPVPGPMQHPGMESMPFGTPFPGQPTTPYDMPQPGMPGMQQPFQPPTQQGMQQPFQPYAQQGMQPPMPQGMRVPQYPPQPPIPHGMQPLAQPTPHGMQPGMPQAAWPGLPPQMPHQQPGQPGMPFGMQPPAQPQMPHGMQPPPPPTMQPPMHAPGQPGMPPSMQPPMPPPGMHSPTQPGMQPPMSSAFPTSGMPRFSVSNLTITPNRVKVGEPVTISVIVFNQGMQTGKYSIVLRIGGVVENISDITLPPGANQTASFNVVKDAAGDYYADVDGLGGFFTVIPLVPPSFSVSNFSISPERVRQGQPITIGASVTNVGEIMGTHTLILRIKGIAESQQEVTLGPGKTQTVEFQIIKDTPGFFPVALENWTGKFVVEMDWTG
jgi:hypothetical protein